MDEAILDRRYGQQIMDKLHTSSKDEVLTRNNMYSNNSS